MCDLTIGIELEAYISDEAGLSVNIEDYPDFLTELSLYCRQHRIPPFSREPSSDAIEFKTNPLKTKAEIYRELEIIYEARFVAREHGVEMNFCGLNPTSNFDNFILSPGRYFRRLMYEDFLRSITTGTCSIHVNMFLPKSLERYLFDLIYCLQEWIWPVSIILQSSPIYNGQFTNYQAGRQILWDIIHPARTGIVPRGLKSWSDFDRYTTLLMKNKVVDDKRKIWWDIRPKQLPDGYLIETRVGDSSSFERSILYVLMIRELYLSLLDSRRSDGTHSVFQSRLWLQQTRENILRKGRFAPIMLSEDRVLTLREWSDLHLSKHIHEETKDVFDRLCEYRTVSEIILDQMKCDRK